MLVSAAAILAICSTVVYAQYGYYHPAAYGGYHPAAYGAYHPAAYGAYHPAAYGGYPHPAAYAGYGAHPAAYGYHPGYHPAYGRYHPGFGYPGHQVETEYDPFGRIDEQTITYPGGPHPFPYGAKKNKAAKEPSEGPQPLPQDERPPPVHQESAYQEQLRSMYMHPRVPFYRQQHDQGGESRFPGKNTKLVLPKQSKDEK